jgi:hypothetical protein
VRACKLLLDNFITDDEEMRCPTCKVVQQNYYGVDADWDNELKWAAICKQCKTRYRWSSGPPDDPPLKVKVVYAPESK